MSDDASRMETRFAAEKIRSRRDRLWGWCRDVFDRALDQIEWRGAASLS